VTQPTLTQVRQALAATITAQTGLRATASQQAQLSPPQAVVLPVTGTFVTYSESMDGACDMSLRALVVVSRLDSSDGMDVMDAYLATTGSKSLYAGVQADRTLGGVVDWAIVREATGYGAVNHGGLDYLGCSVIVDIGI
jgi:hypothetical protein